MFDAQLRILNDIQNEKKKKKVIIFSTKYFAKLPYLSNL